ncbi:uncharacterized protein [Apostichopus japonicus]|uniref:uncharacterized protein n=1 Tax=Stichopus japonicus TaxID=307972 RepID=UPI003AB7AC36
MEFSKRIFRFCRKNMYMVFVILLASAAISSFYVEWIHLHKQLCNGHECSSRDEINIRDTVMNIPPNATLENLANFFNISKNELEKFLAVGSELRERNENMLSVNSSNLLTQIKTSIIGKASYNHQAPPESVETNKSDLESKTESTNSIDNQAISSNAIWDRISSEGSPGVNLTGKWVPLDPRSTSQVPLVSDTARIENLNPSDNGVWTFRIPGFETIFSGFSRIRQMLSGTTSDEPNQTTNVQDDSASNETRELYHEGPRMIEEMEWLLGTETAGTSSDEEIDGGDYENLKILDQDLYSTNSVSQFIPSSSDKFS